MTNWVKHCNACLKRDGYSIFVAIQNETNVLSSVHLRNLFVTKFYTQIKFKIEVDKKHCSTTKYIVAIIYILK